MNTLLDTLQYFVFITIELIALFMLISAAVEIILMYIPEETIRKKLSGSGIMGNVIAAGFGALTPFCACSTIPMTVGFLNAGVPFGSTMSFLIASPLLNPIIIGMLGALVGFKAMVFYFVIAFICSVAFGYVLEKIGAQKYVKNVRVKPSCCSGSEQPKNKRLLPFRQKIKIAFINAWGSLRPIMIYLLIYAARFCVENSRCRQSSRYTCGCRIGYSSVYPCRNSYPHRHSIDGQRYEHRGGYCPRYRWCRNGYSRNEYACQYIQEKTGRHDSGSYLFNGSYRRLCI